MMILSPWTRVGATSETYKCFAKPRLYPLNCLYKRFTKPTWKRRGEIAIVLTPSSTHLLDMKLPTDAGFDCIPDDVRWEYKILETARIKFPYDEHSDEVYGVVSGGLELAMFMADIRASDVGYNIEDLFSFARRI